MKLSIIVPCKNEEGNVEGIYNKITSALKNIKYEIIYVDDGSTDKSGEILQEYAQKDNRIKIISYRIFIYIIWSIKRRAQ